MSAPAPDGLQEALNQALARLGPGPDLVELQPAAAVEVARRAMATFVEGDPRAWWQGLKRPARRVDVPRAGFDYLRSAWPAAHGRAYFIPEDGAGAYRVFDATVEGVVRLLEDCPFFEYYVVARDGSWLLAESDHGVLWVCEAPMTIRFYRLGEPYGEFSNFSRHPITLDGVVWLTSKHYFQAAKFAGTPHQEAVRAARTPMDAARMGRDRSRPLRTDWERVKDDVMRAAVRAKFTQHPALRELLLATGVASLVEATTDDHYWGCGTRGDGKNMLGIILMELRAALRAERP